MLCPWKALTVKLNPHPRVGGWNGRVRQGGSRDRQEGRYGKKGRKGWGHGNEQEGGRFHLPLGAYDSLAGGFGYAGSARQPRGGVRGQVRDIHPARDHARGMQETEAAPEQPKLVELR